LMVFQYGESPPRRLDTEGLLIEASLSGVSLRDVDFGPFRPPSAVF
jgi:hypothetical protein